MKPETNLQKHCNDRHIKRLHLNLKLDIEYMYVM